MDKEAQNKKLAEWVGLKKFHHTTTIGGKIVGEGDYFHTLPDFPQSPDACVKLLIPKLQTEGITVELFAFEHKGFRCILRDTIHNDDLACVRDDSLTSALCLAIEKSGLMENFEERCNEYRG